MSNKAIAGTPSGPRSDFDNRWRHFHPQEVVIVQNPFDHEVEWDVTDDYGTKTTFSIKAHARAELTGGLVHTLGVKEIVDEMIQDDGNILQIWDPVVRAKYEDKVILRVKAAPANTALRDDEGGSRVDLSIRGDDSAEEVEPDEVEEIPEVKETEFPTVAKPVSQDPDIQASLAGKTDKVLEDA